MYVSEMNNQLMDSSWNWLTLMHISPAKKQHVHDLICKTFSFAAYTKYISVSPQICEGHNYAANSIHVDCTLNLGFHSCGCGIWNTEMEQRKYRFGEIMWISYLIPMKYNSNCYLKSNYIFCICVEKHLYIPHHYIHCFALNNPGHLAVQLHCHFITRGI